MKWIDRIVAVLLIALGIIVFRPNSVVFMMEAEPVWFFNGGLILVLLGGVNLVRTWYQSTARGLRWFCFAANLVFAAYWIAFAQFSKTVNWPSGEAAALLVLSALLSLRHSRAPAATQI
jgi:hypothetical protein